MSSNSHQTQIRLILSTLFLLWLTSDLVSVPINEFDIDWEDWEQYEVGSSGVEGDDGRQGSIRAPLLNQTCSCGQGFPKLNATKIVGGVSSRNHGWPWVAAIVRIDAATKRPSVICGGSLINDGYVLTAAHCLTSISMNGLSNYRVFLGGNRINGTNITDRVISGLSSVKVHPMFDPLTINNDIGLIKLNAPVKFTKNLHPVCLSQNGTPFIGRNGTVAGWGITVPGTRNTSNVLREVRVKVISNQQCNSSYPGIITPQMLCSFSKGKDPCQGDSGSPFFIRKNPGVSSGVISGRIYTQIGVVSFGKGCGVVPGVYTRVMKFLNWIKSNTKNSNYCSDSFG